MSINLTDKELIELIPEISIPCDNPNCNYHHTIKTSLLLKEKILKYKCPKCKEITQFIDDDLKLSLVKSMEEHGIYKD